MRVGSRWDCEVWVCEVEQRWYRGGTEVVSGWDRGGIGVGLLSGTAIHKEQLEDITDHKAR